MIAKSEVHMHSRRMLLTCLLAVILIGLADLTGWLFDIEFLRKGLHNFISMSPTDAVCFIFISVYLVSRYSVQSALQKKVLNSLPVIVILIALINLIDVIFSIGINIDFSLIEKLAGPNITDRHGMAEITAVNFILLGSDALLINKIKPDYLLIPIFISMFSSLVAASGYIFDVSQLYSFGGIYLISIYSVVCFLLLNIGFVFGIQNNFIIRINFDRSAAAVMLKTLLPVSFILPLIVISASHYAVINNVYSQNFGEAVEMTLIITILIAFVLWTVNGLYKSDIKLKKARESERHLADIVESSTDVIFSSSPQGIIYSWNNAAEKLFGYKREDILWKHISLLLPADRKQEFEKIIETPFISNTVEHLETVRRKKNGELVDISLNVSRIFDENNSIVGYSHIARDITESKRTEQALRLAGIYNRTLIETSIDPLVTIGPDGKITDVNKATELVTGRTRGELIGTDFSDYFTEPDRAREGYTRVFNEGIVKGFALEIRHLDGHITPVLYNASTYPDESGRTIGVFAEARDITDLKQAEEEIKRINSELEQRVKDRTAELERANNELEAFSYSVSHDLRAPLRAVDGFSKAILEDYHDKLDPEGRHYLNRIRLGSQKMGILIDDLLRLSRISRSDISKSEFKVSPVIHAIANEIKKSHTDRIIEFKIEPDVVVYADKNLLHLVFENLLSNAFKFSSRKEKTVIEFGRCSLNGKFVYFIRDNGVGFDMKYAQNLFAPFHRLHHASEYEGTGIGLATVQRIINKHGGEVWAESKPNSGTTIYFTLN